MKRDNGHSVDSFTVSVTIPATLYSLTPISEQLHLFLRFCTGSFISLHPEIAYALDVALGEAVTNIIRHGLPQYTEQSVEVNFACSARQITMEIHDQGKPIPMILLQQRSRQGWPDLWQPERPESWPEEGLGLMLIYTMMDKVLYRSDPLTNHLTLIKYLTA
ncbi:MAG: ATP-binding protein [Enterobacteriaceae bacterium]